jgi:hypothetical protein
MIAMGIKAELAAGAEVETEDGGGIDISILGYEGY